MDKNKNNVRILFLIGCLLINTITVVLIIASLCFFAGIGISSWQFPLSFILTGVMYFYISKKHYKDLRIFFKSFLICIAVIVISVIIAINFYDLSYDGQT